jgi:hypothetical protein
MKTITAMICATVLGSAYFFFAPHIQLVRGISGQVYTLDTRTGAVVDTGLR